MKTTDKKNQKALKKFKLLLLSFGCDISDMSDEDILEGVARLGKAIASVGVTTKTASDNILCFMRLGL